MGKKINRIGEKEIRSYMKNFVNDMEEDDRIIIGDVIDTIEITIDGRLKSSMGYFTRQI